MDRPDRARLGVGLATLTGLVIRVWYVLAVRRHRPVLGDAYYFHHAANLLVDGKGWIVPLPYHTLGQTQQAADHPPVFVVYLAMWSQVGLTSVTAHLVAGALLGTVAVALVGVVGYRVGGWRVATVAAAFAAVYPNLWGWDGMLLSEPTAVIAVTLVLLAALRFDESPTTWRAVAFGLTIGFAGLCRAELLLLGPLVGLPLAIRARGELGRAAIGRFAAIGVAAVAVVAPWVGYNLTRFEEPVFLSAGLDVTLAYSNCDPAFYGPNTGYFDFSCAALPDLTPEELEELDQSERSTLWRERATSYIARSPRSAPRSGARAPRTRRRRLPALPADAARCHPGGPRGVGGPRRDGGVLRPRGALGRGMARNAEVDDPTVRVPDADRHGCLRRHDDLRSHEVPSRR